MLQMAEYRQSTPLSLCDHSLTWGLLYSIICLSILVIRIEAVITSVHDIYIHMALSIGSILQLDRFKKLEKK